MTHYLVSSLGKGCARLKSGSWHASLTITHTLFHQWLRSTEFWRISNPLMLLVTASVEWCSPGEMFSRVGTPQDSDSLAEIFGPASSFVKITLIQLFVNTGIYVSLDSLTLSDIYSSFYSNKRTIIKFFVGDTINFRSRWNHSDVWNANGETWVTDVDEQRTIMRNRGNCKMSGITHVNIRACSKPNPKPCIFIKNNITTKFNESKQ